MTTAAHTQAPPAALATEISDTARLRVAWWLSWAIVPLAAAASLGGLLLDDLHQDPVSVSTRFRALDLITLVVALPLMVAALGAARRGSRRGQLVWASLLAYAVYPSTSSGRPSTTSSSVVADGAGERSVRESALRGAAGWFSLPTYAVQTVAVALLSGDPPPPSLVDLTTRISPRPLLLIGAGRDNGGEDLQAHYFAAAREPKSYWKIPEASRTGGYAARPAEYERRLLAFFDAALLPGRA